MLARPLERLEDDRLLLGRDTLAAIHHVEPHLAVGHAELDVDRVVLRTVPHRIGQEIDENLPHALRVGVARHHAIGTGHPHGDTLALGRGLDGGHRFPHDGPRIGIDELRLEAVGV